MKHPPATRRTLLGLAVAAVGTGARPVRAATPVPEAVTLMAPGPDEGPAAGFATRAARGLARGLVQAAAVRVSILGGPDGITAANRFAASSAAEDRLLLVLPGLAAQALLVGDSRARFEPRHWPAVAASVLPAVVVGRGGLAETQTVRLALPGPAAPEAAALLALDLLGRPATPVFVSSGVAPEAAVAAGAADAVVATGRALAARVVALGLTPWFTLDGQSATREPGLGDVPAIGELLPDSPRADLITAMRAAGAGLRVRGVVVLPALTSADAVAMWRTAARRWADEEPDTVEPGSRRLSPEEASDALATLCPPQDAALAYRDWLLRRLAFQAT